jgi:hypothetical protein
MNRIDETRVPKKVFETKPEGKRDVGKAETEMCVSEAENDLRELNVKWWRQNASNKEEWTSVVKKVKVFRGPQNQGVS